MSRSNKNHADDNEHLIKHRAHTLANLHAAEDYLDEHAADITPGRKHKIEDENKRRQESIKGFEIRLNKDSN